MNGGLRELKRLVGEQAEDEGLWANTINAQTAYLQQELRRLHALVESDVLNTLTEQGGEGLGDEDRERLVGIAQRIERMGGAYLPSDPASTVRADLDAQTLRELARTR